MRLSGRLAMELLGLALAVTLGGCVVDASPSEGEIDFTWLFDQQGCPQAGVATVGVQILDIDGNTVINDTVACSLGGITYDQIDDGNYTFQMEGLAADGEQLYGAGAPITVHSGVNEIDVNLTLAQ